jgi:hypothetical protein
LGLVFAGTKQNPPPTALSTAFARGPGDDRVDDRALPVRLVLNLSYELSSTADHRYAILRVALNTPRREGTP